MKIILVVFLLAFQTQGLGPGRYYDSKGSFSGQVTKGGSVYSQNGSYLGRQDSRGMYNASGSKTSSTVTSGGTTRFYSPTGKYQGKSVTSGSTTRFYNSTGSATGSYSGGTFRSSTNKYEGTKKR